MCSEIPICVPCIVCEATGKTIVNDWCCSCLNAENVTGMVGDSDFRDLTQKRYQSLSTSQEDHDGKDGDTREKYVAAQCTKEFILNFPCITLFTNFPTKINFCYPCEKPVEGHGRPGTPLMAYQCIFWLCEHPTKILYVYLPTASVCTVRLSHCRRGTLLAGKHEARSLTLSLPPPPPPAPSLFPSSAARRASAA